jgi:hypothetical protein
VAKDLLRYSKALTWLLNLEKIDINLVKTIAPYVISHRVKYTTRELEKSPHWGNPYDFSKSILDTIQKRFINRADCYLITERFRDGEPKSDDLTTLKNYQKNDLIVKYDLIPFVNSINNKEYSKIAQKIKRASRNGEIEVLANIRDDLLENIDFPNRAYLINVCNQELYKQTVSNYIFKYVNNKEIWADIATDFPNLDKPLKEAFMRRQTKQIRTEDLLIEINVTGTNDDSLVNIQISGGSEALRLRKIIERLEYIQKEE